jgi:hypothetical protein
MPVVEALSETVVFELVGQAAGDSLCERLRPRWFVGLYERDDLVLVAAELRPEEGDLAALLLAVKAWAADSRIPALPFHLDGREYVLESGGPIPGASAPVYHG